MVDQVRPHRKEPLLGQERLEERAFKAGDLLPFGPEARAAPVAAGDALRRPDLRRGQGEIIGIVFHEVPRIGPELVLQAIQEPRGAVQAKGPFPPQADPEQVVETDEVVHVGMGDEDVADLQDVPGDEIPEVTQVEEDSVAPVLAVQVDNGVLEGIVDEGGSEHGAEGSSGFAPL